MGGGGRGASGDAVALLMGQLVQALERKQANGRGSGSLGAGAQNGFAEAASQRGAAGLRISKPLEGTKPATSPQARDARG
jgi:hypothetical protein